MQPPWAKAPPEANVKVEKNRHTVIHVLGLLGSSMPFSIILPCTSTAAGSTAPKPTTSTGSLNKSKLRSILFGPGFAACLNKTPLSLNVDLPSIDLCKYRSQRRL